MDIIRISRNITIIAFILSLLFHGSTIFYIFLQKTRNPLLTEIEQDEQKEALKKQHKDNSWVETRARADNFGAPVFFQDEPSNTETTHDTHRQEIPLSEQNSMVTDVTDQDDIETEEETPDQDSTISAQESLAKTDTIFEAPIQPKPKNHTKNPIAKKRSRPKKKSQQNPIDAPRSAPKPPLTLAQLTQGFLNQRKEDAGIHGISMVGMKNGLPTDEQMKYERYLQKLSWCLQNSFTIHERRTPLIAMNSDIYLFFALDRDGILKHVSVKKSSGNKLMDDFILFIFRDASSSFPPVPGYLPHDPFQMTCIIPLKIIVYQ